MLDCCHELMTETLPQLPEGPAQVHLHMLVGVLQNAAVRSAHEIAWMREEAAEMRAYVRSVLDSQGSDPVVSDALDAISARPDSLHLDDVIEDYGVASKAFAAALERVMLDGTQERRREGRRFSTLGWPTSARSWPAGAPPVVELRVASGLPVRSHAAHFGVVSDRRRQELVEGSNGCRPTHSSGAGALARTPIRCECGRRPAAAWDSGTRPC